MKKIVPTCTIFIVLITATILILMPKQNSKISYEVFKARADINSYFQAIIKENYAKASKYVSFFNAEDDIQLTANDELKNNWIIRISDLSKKNIKVNSIKELDVRTIDGVICAQITLEVNDVGFSDNVTYMLELDVNANASIFDVKYKIKDVTDEEIRIEIEDALSGIVK